MRRVQVWMLMASVVLLLVIAGCGSNSTTPAPSPTASATSTARTAATPTNAAEQPQPDATSATGNVSMATSATSAPPQASAALDTATHAPTAPPANTPTSVAYATPDVPPGGFNAWEHPATDDAFDVPGYTLVKGIGKRLMPITPIDVLVLPDGTTLVADLSLDRVLVFDASGNYLPQWGDIEAATTGGSMFRLASGMDGSIYTLTLAGDIRRFDANGQLDASWALDWESNGTIIPAGLSPFTGLAVDRAGRVYVSAEYRAGGGRPTPVLLQFAPDGNVQRGWDVQDMCQHGDLALDARDQLYLACSLSVYRLTADFLNADATTRERGTVDRTATFWDGDVGPTETMRASSVAFAPDGTLLIHSSTDSSRAGLRDTYGQRQWIDRVSVGGETLATWSVPGTTQPWSRPVSIGIDATGNVYLPDTLRYAVRVFAPDGSMLRDINAGWADGIARVDRVSVLPDGRLLMLDQARQWIHQYAGDGTPLGFIRIPELAALADMDEPFHPDTPLAQAGDLSWDMQVASDGSIVILMKEPNVLVRLNADGSLISEIDLGPTVETPPFGLELDHDGNAWLFTAEAGELLVFPPDSASREDAIPVPQPLPLDSLDPLYDLHLTNDHLYAIEVEDTDEDATSVQLFVRVFTLDGTDEGHRVTMRVDPSAIEVPLRMTTDAAGQIYLITFRLTVDPANPSAQNAATDAMLRVFAVDGQLVSSAYLGPVSNAMPDITVNADGSRLYLSDPASRQVLIYERD